MPLTTVDDVAKMLRWGDAERDKNEAQILAYIEAASTVVEDEAGPFEPREVTHTADGGPSVALPYRVNSVTSVTVDGAAAGYTVDLSAGIVYGPFARGRQNVVVTFTTGFSEVPEAAKLAATMVACDMWAIASQRAPGLDDRVDTAYLIPKTVRALLAPFKTMPGFA